MPDLIVLMTSAPATKTTVDWEEMAALSPEWDELAAAVDAGPFQRPGWFEAWLRAFGRGREPKVLAARREGRLVGALPMFRRGGAAVSPTNWHTPSFDAVAADDEAIQALGHELVASVSSRLDLSFLDLERPLARLCLDAAKGAGRRVICRPVLRSPYVQLEGDFDAYEETLETKFRRETARRRRRLEEQGRLEIAFTDGSEELETQLREGFAVEASGWKAEHGSAIASHPETEAFYSDVASWAADRGWLQLGFLRLDGRALAFSFLLVLADTMHVVKVGFDPEYRKFAPGSLLTRASIQRAFEQGLSCYDFLG